MSVRPAHARRVVAAILAALVAAACSSDGESTADKASKTIVIGSAPSSSSVIVANMYAGALQNDGYQVTLRKGLGTREIYLPALQKGGPDNGIDLAPEYVGTLLEFVNKNAGEASGNLDDSVTKLRRHLDAIGLTALNPSPAADQLALAMTRATADRLRLARVSDLTPVAGQLTLAAGPECQSLPSCLPGLEKTYGLKFKEFKPRGTGCGLPTLEALSAGEADVGLVCSSAGAIAARDLVVLEDDKKLQKVDNVIPAIRKDVVDDGIRTVLNKVSAALTTADLVQLNMRVEVDKADPDALAQEWLAQHGFTKKN